ncbi:MAG: hypothetical protein WBF33_00465, partial [Candidatus Nitrosopolaris sp.]
HTSFFRFLFTLVSTGFRFGERFDRNITVNQSNWFSMNCLVFLAYILLQILRYRLLSYRITKAVPSMEFVMSWVRKKTRQRFIHYIWNKLKQGISIRSLIMTVSKIDTVYA